MEKSYSHKAFSVLTPKGENGAAWLHRSGVSSQPIICLQDLSEPVSIMCLYNFLATLPIAMNKDFLWLVSNLLHNS